MVMIQMMAKFASHDDDFLSYKDARQYQINKNAHRQPDKSNV